MEYILISLFGGGTADWQDISKTNYDWEDIFDRAKIDFDMGNIDINTLYYIILEMAISELGDKMQEYQGEKSEEFEQCSNDMFNYFEIYTNCLDSHVTFVGSEELAEEIQEKLGEEIDQINHDIAFTYIEF